jgi:hypothetical protein
MNTPQVGSTWTKQGCPSRTVACVRLKGDAPDTLRMMVQYRVNNTWVDITLESWNRWAKQAKKEPTR